MAQDILIRKELPDRKELLDGKELPDGKELLNIAEKDLTDNLP